MVQPLVYEISERPRTMSTMNTLEAAVTSDRLAKATCTAIRGATDA